MVRTTQKQAGWKRKVDWHRLKYKVHKRGDELQEVESDNNTQEDTTTQ